MIILFDFIVGITLEQKTNYTDKFKKNIENVKLHLLLHVVESNIKLTYFRSKKHDDEWRKQMMVGKGGIGLDIVTVDSLEIRRHKMFAIFFWRQKTI